VAGDGGPTIPVPAGASLHPLTGDILARWRVSVELVVLLWFVQVRFFQADRGLGCGILRQGLSFLRNEVDVVALQTSADEHAHAFVAKCVSSSEPSSSQLG
jgi:hypothetical protein